MHQKPAGHGSQPSSAVSPSFLPTLPAVRVRIRVRVRVGVRARGRGRLRVRDRVRVRGGVRGRGRGRVRDGAHLASLARGRCGAALTAPVAPGADLALDLAGFVRIFTCWAQLALIQGGVVRRELQDRVIGAERACGLPNAARWCVEARVGQATVGFAGVVGGVRVRAWSG